LPTSRKVRSSPPSGSGMGSSNVRCQPLSGINRNPWTSCLLLLPPASPCADR
jgi:hypothetical protein